MAKYTDYWKPKLKLLKDLLDSGQNPVIFDISDIKEIGQRQDENYPGYVNIRFGATPTNTNAQHFRDLSDLITKTYILRPYSSNELKIRITDDFQLTTNYTKFTNEDLIRVYKGLIANGNPQEIYKWHTLNKQHWDLVTDDLLGMYRAIPFHNLVYHDAKRVMQHIIPLYTEEVRACLNELFDETKNLYNRIVDFRSKIQAIYRRVESKLGTHHDERTIATYLTYRYPEKYALYKEGFYVKYCKMLGVAPETVNKKYIHYLSLLNQFKTGMVDKDHELLVLVDAFKDAKSFDDNNHLLLSQDILYQTLVGKWENDTDEEFSDETTIASQNKKLMAQSLNTILYGPPGTGKTYNTINKAISIVNPVYDFKGKTRQQVRREYERLVNSKHIEFCTFHQSLSYEDFIEGIKPVAIGDNAPIQYKVLPGIFKRIATRASYLPDVQTKVFSITEEQFAKAQFYKMSLGDSKDVEDDAIFQYCIDNGCIALGWGDDINFTGKSEREITQMANNKDIERFEGIAVNYFIHFIKPGDYVMISRGNTVLRAIGKVTGAYEYKADSPIRYHQFRKVEWILKDKDIPVNELYNKNFSQQTIYQLDKKQIKKDFFVKAQAAAIPSPATPENYVLIIDEINRGNVSAIFGELITLIEEDKRKGNKEALTAILPYSGESFSVPNNLYIIGTMNTADRSVEALDSALRRRFSFVEMTPDSKLLIKDDGTDKIVSDISLKGLLDAINERIAYLLDDDHRIGHSYFYDIADEDLAGLMAAFNDKIIPLLKEYFYNDYEKILLVLGSGFVTEQKKKPVFAGRKQSDIDRAVFIVNSISDQTTFVNALKITVNAQL